MDEEGWERVEDRRRHGNAARFGVEEGRRGRVWREEIAVETEERTLESCGGERGENKARNVISTRPPPEGGTLCVRVDFAKPVIASVISRSPEIREFNFAWSEERVEGQRPNGVANTWNNNWSEDFRRYACIFS